MIRTSEASVSSTSWQPRSPAIGEDGAAASFAGQNLTRIAMPPTPMADIIQTMIPADVAGVMCTRDPRTGTPDRLTEAS